MLADGFVWRFGARTGALARPWLPIERLPKPLLCVPLVLQWMMLALRHRSLTLPSAINPAIETGGLAGESKSAVLGQIGPALGSYVAAWTVVVPGADPAAVRHAAGFAYPIIAKPDVGWCGYGVCRIADDAALRAYAAAFPADGTIILQRLVTAPNEAGLFYVREPGAARGALMGIAVRHTPHVTGDGAHSVRDLIGNSPRTRRRGTYYAGLMDPATLARIPGAGERVALGPRCIYIS